MARIADAELAKLVRRVDAQVLGVELEATRFDARQIEPFHRHDPVAQENLVRGNAALVPAHREVIDADELDAALSAQVQEHLAACHSCAEPSPPERTFDGTNPRS